MLYLQTVQEFNNKGFDILRKTNGSFEKIEFVSSTAVNGNSTSPLSYNYQDRLPIDASTVFYRLAQIVIDGKQFLSDIRAINNGGSKKALLVYPNPSRGNLQIILPSDLVGKWDLRIFNTSGAAIQSINKSTDNRVDITGLQPGIYIVKVYTHFNNTALIKKLIVQ